MLNTISAPTLKSWLHDGGEIGLFDVREAGQFGEGHLFYAVPLPYSRFELDLPRLAPRRSARLVLHGGGDPAIPARAARRARDLGYTDVSILEGGTDAWVAAGYPLFKGVNVVSKAFGELAEHAFETPSLSAAVLQSRLAKGDDLIILDGRPRDEFAKMSIPGAICCPNGELAYRWQEIVPNPKTTIVINCAGRTRSIIGAQTLRNIGIPNPVYALRNGTMGWRLAGHELDQGQARHYPEVSEAKQRDALVQRGRALAHDWRVPVLDTEIANVWLRDSQRSTYLLDVRTAEEFSSAHAPGAQLAPGGQLVQAADQWLGVRGGRIILLDDAVIRAVTTARWLRLMGWEAAILPGGAEIWAAIDAGARSSRSDDLPILPVANPDSIEKAVVLDLRPSQAYRQGHIAGARWAIRPNLAPILADLPRDARLVLATPEPDVARAFAADLPADVLARTSLLAGDIADWRAGGAEIVASPHIPSDAESIDYLFFVHDRHAGNLQAAQQYLDWETGLVAQLDRQELDSFRLPPPAHPPHLKQSRG